MHRINSKSVDSIVLKGVFMKTTLSFFLILTTTSAIASAGHYRKVDLTHEMGSALIEENLFDDSDVSLGLDITVPSKFEYSINKEGGDEVCTVTSVKRSAKSSVIRVTAGVMDEGDSCIITVTSGNVSQEVSFYEMGT